MYNYPMTSNIRRSGFEAGQIAAALFMSAVFFAFFHPIAFGDFWWHLTSGRWIVEHLSLPSSDILSYSTASDSTARKTVMLKNYWLFQSGLYLTYKWFGFMGIAVINAAIFSFAYLLLFRMLRRGGFDYYPALLVLAPSIILATGLDEVRPHSFSFLFSVLLFQLLDKGTGPLMDGRGPRIRALACASALMALWPNLHPGVVIGYFIIFVFFVAGAVRLLRSDDPGRFGRLRTLALWSGFMVLCSFANPTGVLPLAVGLAEPFQWTTHEGILEHSSAWQYALNFGKMRHLASLALLLSITSAIMAAAWRRLRAPHLALYAVFAYAAFAELRLTMFFGFLSIAIAALYAPDQLRNMRRWTRISAMVMVLCITAYFIPLPVYAWRSNPKPYQSDKLPEKATAFLMDNGLESPVYNPFNWGGYLSWQLYPSKVFITALLIDKDAYLAERAISGGLRYSLLDSYGVKTVLCDPVHIAGNEISGLVVALLRDPGWRLIYMDEVAAIFSRSDSAPPAIDKTLLWKALLSYSERKAAQNPDDESTWNELSALYFGLRQWDKAGYAMEQSRRLAAKGGR